MKIAVINYSGNVGKTTLVAHLLKPRMDDSKVYSIESINEGVDNFGVEAETLRGGQFTTLFRELMLLDDAIIDVGASNVEDFMAKLLQLDGGYEEIDEFIVPVVAGNKEMKESLATIDTLSGMGVDAKKIKVVFNRVEASVEDEFGPFVNTAKRGGNCVINTKVMVFESEIFDLLSNRKMTLNDALNDDNDYKAALRALDRETNAKEFRRLSDMAVIQKMAKAVNRNFNKCFEELMK